MTPDVTVAFAPTPQGIADARRQLDDLEEEMLMAWTGEAVPAVAGPASATAMSTEPIVRVYKQTVGDGRSRELLEKLPVGKDEALMPEELGAHVLDPDEDDNALEKGSVRAIYRNVRRAEGNLRKNGLIDRKVIQVDFSGYSKEGAGRYYVSEHDRKALDTYLGR